MASLSNHVINEEDEKVQSEDEISNSSPRDRDKDNSDYVSSNDSF